MMDCIYASMHLKQLDLGAYAVNVPLYHNPAQIVQDAIIASDRRDVTLWNMLLRARLFQDVCQKAAT
jgi:hypothetical protein